MKRVPVKVDSTQKEYMPYIDVNFPLDIWTDEYDTFVDETLNCHWHPDFEFSVLVSGELEFNVNGNPMYMTTGDCIFINSNTMHTAKQAKSSQNAVVKGVAFPASLLVNSTSSMVYKRHFEPIMSSPIQGMIIPGDSGFAIYLSYLIEEIHNLSEEDFACELEYLNLINRLWKDTLMYISKHEPELLQHKTNRKNEDRAKKILSYIHENFQSNLTIDRLAKEVNISRSECFRCFKHFTNKKPIEYINEYRLANAARLLMESTLSVTEIGIACGFNSSSYFGKMFKEIYGVSPKEYRKG